MVRALTWPPALWLKRGRRRPAPARALSFASPPGSFAGAVNFGGLLSAAIEAWAM